MTNLHGAARQWAKFIPIFPCLPNAKQPATPNGFKDASRDLGQIDVWWSASGHGLAYNIAACPDDARCYVIDIDGEEGEENFRTMIGDIDAATLFMVRTPRGGRHLWLPGRRPSSQSKLAPKVDVRGVGGYVLLPPSAINGIEYAFIV